MKLDDTKRRLIVVGIALILILFGVLQGAFKIKMNLEVVNQISFVLMMIAAWLLLSGKKFGKDKPENPSDTPPTEETEADATHRENASLESGSGDAAPKE